ncbi:MAG: OmpA family protein [Candidatus Omnitrophota bacterium]|jgi:chemotaxis protein MotB
MRKNFLLFTLLFCFIFVNGCAVIFQTGRRSDIERIKTLEKELEELRQTKGLLEQTLEQEIKDKQVRLSMEEKGLVITFVSEVLFDSGKASLKPESFSSLDKVAKILVDNVPGNNIGIEGHTDNEPIKRSKWKSNWELSAHRALSVLEYLEEKGVNSERLSASGYGEYKPVASNDTAQDRQLNRRVEIVILPKTVKKVQKQASEDGAYEPSNEGEEELK